MNLQACWHLYCTYSRQWTCRHTDICTVHIVVIELVRILTFVLYERTYSRQWTCRHTSHIYWLNLLTHITGDLHVMPLCSHESWCSESHSLLQTYVKFACNPYILSSNVINSVWFPQECIKIHHSLINITASCGSQFVLCNTYVSI